MLKGTIIASAIYLVLRRLQQWQIERAVAQSAKENLAHLKMRIEKIRSIIDTLPESANGRWPLYRIDGAYMRICPDCAEEHCDEPLRSDRGKKRHVKTCEECGKAAPAGG